MLTTEMISQIWPHGDMAVPGLLAAIATQSSGVFQKHGLTSTLVVAHAMAQFSHECSAGTMIEENLHYSAHGRC
jgi:putative chitinase